MKKNNFKLIQKHVFESIDYALDASVFSIYKNKLKNPNTQIKDLVLRKNSFLFTSFGTFIGAKINMNEFWSQNKVYLLTIKQFKELVLKEYIKIQEETKKSVTKEYISSAILKQYENLAPDALLAIQKVIQDHQIIRG